MSEKQISNINADPLLAALLVNSWYLAQSLHITQGNELTPGLERVFDETLMVEELLKNSSKGVPGQQGR